MAIILMLHYWNVFQNLQYYIISLQYKEVGEPREKKGKSLLDEDDEEEGPNEEPEDVISLMTLMTMLHSHKFSWLRNCSKQSFGCFFVFQDYVLWLSFLAHWLCLVLQRILSCKKAGSVLREARDRVVSLVADPKAEVLACHVCISFHSAFKFKSCLLVNTLFLINLNNYICRALTALWSSMLFCQRKKLERKWKESWKRPRRRPSM